LGKKVDLCKRITTRYSNPNTTIISNNPDDIIPDVTLMEHLGEVKYMLHIFFFKLIL
jgi:hypothetical protein